MKELHGVQMQILRELLYSPGARFSDLNISGLTSDHFTYHMTKLVELGLVEKFKKGYALTPKGKEYANKMDTDTLSIERQPKTTAIVIGMRKNGKRNELLIQTRQKEPYLGYKGFVSGKVRFGETIEATAKRELLEETGLEGKVKLKLVLHEHIHNDGNELLEDKIFYIFTAIALKGDLHNTKEGTNEWMTREEFISDPKHFYDEKDILEWIKSDKLMFIEKNYTVEGF